MAQKAPKFEDAAAHFIEVADVVLGGREHVPLGGVVHCGPDGARLEPEPSDPAQLVGAAAARLLGAINDDLHSTADGPLVFPLMFLQGLVEHPGRLVRLERSIVEKVERARGLRRLGRVTSDGRTRRAPPTDSETMERLVDAAIEIVELHPDWSKKRIAGHVGFRDASKLSKSLRFKAAQQEAQRNAAAGSWIETRTLAQAHADDLRPVKRSNRG